MVEALKLTSFALLVLGAYLLFAAVSTRRRVRARSKRGRQSPLAAGEEREKSIWIQIELDRAWSLIESPDENEVIAGLQILSALGSSIVHLQFLRRLLALTKHVNGRVAEQARVTVQKVSRLTRDS